MRNILLVFLAVLLLGGAYAGVQVFLAEDEVPVATIEKKEDKKPTWNGTGTRPLNTTFIRSSQQITVQKIEFAGLNTTVSKATMVLVVPAQNNKLPKWVAQNAFTARTTDSIKLKTKVGQSAERDGANYIIRVSVEDIPTDRLGAVCGQNGVPAETVLFTIKGPDTPFTVGLLAPEPPAGSCLASEKAKEAVPEK